MNAKLSPCVDRFWPVALAAIVGASYFFFSYGELSGSKVSTVLQAGSTMSAIAVGFLANLKATMFSMDDRESIQKIRRAGFHGALVNRLVDAIHIGFMLAIVSCVGFFRDFTPSPRWEQPFVAVWIGLALYAVLACFRVIHIFKLVLRLK